MSQKYINGFTCGTFDLFHAGHVSMLREARKYCEHLTVGIQVDPSVDRPFKNKPVQSILERQIQVQACRYVDETIVYSTEDDLLILLRTLPIDVRFLGKEYQDKEYTGKHLHQKQFYVFYNQRSHNFSSSELRQRIQGSTKNELEG
jgi:glycerol-3-phosphate cytidylyltransferase